MVAVADTRKTRLEVINEVRRKLGTTTVTTLDADNLTRTLVEYLNDVISEINDYGDWQEMLFEVVVTASSSIRQYAVSTSVPVQGIREVSFNNKVAPLWLRTIEEIRRWRRTGSIGEPQQYAIMGTNDQFNPLIEVYPMPASAQDNQTFNILAYKKPVQITASSTTSAFVPFPARLVAKGLLAKAYRDETAMAQDFAIVRQEFQDDLEETWNRYNGDTGDETQFVPRSLRFRHA